MVGGVGGPRALAGPGQQVVWKGFLNISGRRGDVRLNVRRGPIVKAVRARGGLAGGPRARRIKRRNQTKNAVGASEPQSCAGPGQGGWLRRPSAKGDLMRRG